MVTKGKQAEPAVGVFVLMFFFVLSLFLNSLRSITFSSNFLEVAKGSKNLGIFQSLIAV